jgi:Protein of unknown function (DUF2934)
MSSNRARLSVRVRLEGDVMPKTKPSLREVESEREIETNPDVETQPSGTITQEEIAQRAYALYEARGREDGHDLDDWLEAERELLEQRSR